MSQFHSITGYIHVLVFVTKHIFYFQLFQAYLSFCGIGLSNAQLFEMSVQEYKRNQVSQKLWE